jgi:homoserine kinase type II
MGAQLLQHPDLDAQDQKVLQAELHYQAKMDYSALPCGVIHADLFRDNAMFSGDTLRGIIDFYYACTDSFLFDIAVVVNDWCYPTPEAIDTQKLSALLNAYHVIRPLQATEQTQWFAMLKAAALRFWLSRLYDQLYPREGELTQSKDPNEFKHKLAILEHSQQQLADHWPYNATTYAIDARRLLCPMPVIRVQEMIETLQTGDRIIATCTDAGVMHDIPAWVRVHGHQVISAEAHNNEYIITVEVV